MDDVIYRQVLRDAMYHEAFEVDSDLQKWDGGCWIRYKMFENVIDKIPSAQKKGHWIYDSEAYALGNPYGHYDCDQCGESVPRKTNFCPNCGADMREETDEC